MLFQLAQYEFVDDNYANLQTTIIELEDASAMFFDPNWNRLYVLNGFMLNMYESPSITTSRCFVIYFSLFFNCSETVFEKMNTNKYRSSEEYLHDVDSHHRGKMLPAKCKKLTNMPDGWAENIQFENKTESDSEKGLIFIACSAVVVIILLCLICFYLLCYKSATRTANLVKNREKNFNKFISKDKASWRDLLGTMSDSNEMPTSEVPKSYLDQRSKRPF